MKEVWKPVGGYENLYEVSNLGRVKSLKCWSNIYKKYFDREKMLKNRKDKLGYYNVALCFKGKQKNYKVHRLVAQSFIPNINDLNEVNHINGDKTNNNANNLEWCSHQQNCVHRASKLKKGNIKRIIQYNLQGNFIKEWNSLLEASKTLKINKSNIGECCRNKRKTAGGYIWRWSL